MPGVQTFSPAVMHKALMAFRNGDFSYRLPDDSGQKFE